MPCVVHSDERQIRNMQATHKEHTVSIGEQQPKNAWTTQYTLSSPALQVANSRGATARCQSIDHSRFDSRIIRQKHIHASIRTVNVHAHD